MSFWRWGISDRRARELNLSTLEMAEACVQKANAVKKANREADRALEAARQAEIMREANRSAISSANRIAETLVKEQGANVKNTKDYHAFRNYGGSLNFARAFYERVDYELSMLREPMIEGDIGWWPNPYRRDMTEADL